MKNKCVIFGTEFQNLRLKDPLIKLFCNNVEAQKLELLKNGVSLGQTWNGLKIVIKNAGEAMNYMAPQEGSLE
jgi:hypothetical protein